MGISGIIRRSFRWCRERDLNPHGRLCPHGPQPCASAISATSATTVILAGREETVNINCIGSRSSILSVAFANRVPTQLIVCYCGFLSFRVGSNCEFRFARDGCRSLSKTGGQTEFTTKSTKDTKNGIRFKLQHHPPVEYKSMRSEDCGHRVDVLVEDRLILSVDPATRTGSYTPRKCS